MPVSRRRYEDTVARLRGRWRTLHRLRVAAERFQREREPGVAS